MRLFWDLDFAATPPVFPCSLRSTALKSKRRSRQRGRLWRRPCSSPSKVRLQDSDEPGSSFTACSTLCPAVIGNACGTIGLLHAVANASTLTGGSVELSACAFSWVCSGSGVVKSPPGTVVCECRGWQLFRQVHLYHTGHVPT